MRDWARCMALESTTAAYAVLPHTLRTGEPGSPHARGMSVQERNDPDPIASLTDVQMLTQCDGGRHRAEADLHRLLRETGFEPGPTRPTAGPALVEATAG